MPRTARHSVVLVTLAVAALCACALLAGLSGARVFSADAGSATAHAASVPASEAFAIDGPVFQKAREVAQGHWGAGPCQGEIAFAWIALEPLTNARATWSNPTDAWHNAPANFDCRVDFNDSAGYDFPMLCTVMTHELGHLLGHQHEREEGQLMSPVYTTPLPECVAADPDPSAAVTVVGDDLDDVELEDEELAPARRAAPRKVKSKSKNKATAARRGAAKRVKRCVVRYKAGKRVKRCVVLTKRTARKARKASHRAASR